MSGAAPAALRDRWLLCWMAAGLLLRVAAALWADERGILIADDRIYADAAAALNERGAFETGAFVRPPLYVLFLGAVRLLAGAGPDGLGWLLWARLLQCVAGVATAVPIYRTGVRLGGVGAGRLAAAFFLLEPTFVAYSHLLWPETLFLLLVSIVFDGVARLSNETPARAAGLGAVTGLALLLKPVFGLFTLLLAVEWLRRLGWRTALRLALLFGGAAALVIAPWVVRNQLRYGPAIVIENQGPYNLWAGNDPRPNDAVLGEWRAVEDPVERSRLGVERGVAAITADPGGFVRRSALRALHLWGLEFFVVRNAIFASYGLIPREAVLAIFWVVELGTVVLLAFAALGIPRALRDPTLRLAFGYAAVLTLLVAAMVSTTRFRVPLALPLCVAAALGARDAWARRIAPRSWLALACALALLAFSATRGPFPALLTGDFEAVADLRVRSWWYFRF